MRKYKFYLMFLIFCVPQAKATLIQTDLSAPGDGLLTYDSASGLEWLDLTETYSLFGRDVLANISGGGIWDGFHIATREEVSSLWSNAGIPFFGGPARPLYNSVSNLVSLLGGESSVRGLTSTTSGSLGYSGEKLSIECHFDIFEGGNVCTGAALLNSYFNNNYENTSSSDGGTWLAREAVNPPALVPAPGSFFLYFSALIAVFCKRLTHSKSAAVQTN